MRKICLIFILSLSFFTFINTTFAEVTKQDYLTLGPGTDDINEKEFGYVRYEDITFPCHALETVLNVARIYIKNKGYDTYFGYITKSRYGGSFYPGSVYEGQQDTFVMCYGNYSSMKFSSWNYGYYFQPKECKTYFYSESWKELQGPANSISIHKDLSSNYSSVDLTSTSNHFYFYYNAINPTPIYTNLDFIESSTYCIDDSTGETSQVDLSDLHPYFLLVALCVLLVFIAIMFKRRRYL